MMTREERRGATPRAGQSTLEYFLVWAAIIAAIAIAAGTLIRPAVTKAMNDSKGVIENATGKLKGGLGL